MFPNRFPRITVVVMALAMTAMLGGCGEESSDNSTGPSPNPSGVGVHPESIATPASGMALNPTLHWHPVGLGTDEVVYDLYLGLGSGPGLYASGIADTCYTAGPLQPASTYYWSVAARINGNATAQSDQRTLGTKESITYPMAIGNRWEYRRERTAFGTASSYHVVTVLSTDTGWSVDPIYVFGETWFAFQNMALDSSLTYNHANSAGLFLAGYDGERYATPTGYSFPFSVGRLTAAADLSGRFIGPSRNALGTEDIVIEDPFRLGLEYPLEIGAEWVFRNGDPRRIEKSCEAFEIIEVPAGEFGCFVVQWQVDLNGDGSFNDNVMFTDYIAEQGLIKRAVLFPNVLVLDEFGNEVGFIDITDDFDLIAYELE